MTPTVLSDYETLDRIISGRLSVSRFGDGECKVVDGGGTRTQDGDVVLTERMRAILKSDDPRVLVCILDLWSNKPIGSEWASRQKTTDRFGRQKWVDTYLLPGKEYGCASITRLCNWALGDHDAWWVKVRQVWADRPVLLVCGSKKGRSTYKLLDSAASVQVWDLQQKLNCWARYPRILEECRNWALSRAPGRDPIVLAALGATATVLAYDLGVEGIQCFDVGHMAQSFHRISPKGLPEP